MASLVQSGDYGSINTKDISTIGYSVIKFVSYAYTLQEDTTCYGQIISSGELVVKAHYLSCTQEDTNWYLEHKNQKKIIIVLTRTIVHPCLDIMEVNMFLILSKLFEI